MKNLVITDFSSSGLTKAGFIPAHGTSALDGKTQVRSGWYRIRKDDDSIQVDLVNPDSKSAVTFTGHEASLLVTGVASKLGISNSISA